jgi:hypothetical protein
MARVLYPGDTIEFSVSQELPVPKGASTRVKAGATTTIPMESTAQAKARLVDFVIRSRQLMPTSTVHLSRPNM